MRKAFHLEWPRFKPGLSIETDCERIYQLYQILEGAFFCPGRLEGAPLATILKSPGGYRLSFNGMELETECPAETLQDLYRDVLRADEDFFPVHGGAVAVHGRAAVFAGATSKGKTTLTAYLAARGFPYLTDDCVLIHKEDFRVYPYLKPIHLRPGGYDALRGAGVKLPETQYADTLDPRYCYLPERLQETPLPLEAVYFTNYSDHNSLERPSSAAALELLLKSPIQPQKLSGAYLGFLIALLKKADCRVIHYRDLDYVEAILLEGGERHG